MLTFPLHPWSPIWRGFVAIFVLGHFALGVAQARPALNDTGMTRCVVNGAFSDVCTGTGQDGEFGRDVTQPKGSDGAAGFSFEKVCNNGDIAGTGACPTDPSLGAGDADWACTRDKVTGLTWEVKTTDGGLRDKSRLYTQKLGGQANSAMAFVSSVNAMGLCGATDWRLPGEAELAGIVHHGVAPPNSLIDANWFPNTPAGAGGTWAADGLASDPAKAWTVNFDNGVSGFTKRQYLRFVQLVRGAAVPASLRPKGDEVADAATGLIWRRCSEGQSWDGATCTGLPQGREWQDALAWAQAEAARTGLGWRLPNAKELASIVDRGASRPAINRKAFPDTPKDGWNWTSTPMAGDASSAWIVGFDSGFVARLNYPTYVFNLRLVRDAP